MKNYLNRVRWRILTSLCALSILFSCIDNYWKSHNTIPKQMRKSKHKNEELTVNVAQQWYEKHYAPIVTTRSSITDSTNRMIKPHWEKAKELNRKRYEVVEIPIKTKGCHLILDAETGQNWSPGTYSKYIRNTAKIVIEKDKQTSRIRSFVMIFVGSYKYLQKTRNMGNNSYLYRQPDFDGSVLFYELNGFFINGWKYEDGKINATISPKSDDDSIGLVQSRAEVEECITIPYIYYDEDCTENGWAEEDDEYGFSFGTTVTCEPIRKTKYYTSCFYYDDGQDDYDWEEDNWEEDNWEEDYPIGGSNTSYNDDTHYEENNAESNMNFPPYEEFCEIYAKVACLNSPEVYKLIGGHVYQNYLNDPIAFANACALRLCYAFNMAGEAYKIPFSLNKTGSGDADKDGIKEWYYYKALDMTEYLNNTYGHYKEVYIGDIQGKKGIIGLYDCGWNNATGHLDVWNGYDCIKEMYPNCQTVYFWEMK